MPKEFFIEQPAPKEVESKLEELKKYPDLRPRLTVAWPVTKEKEQLLDMVNAEEITKKEDIEKIKELQKSDDFLDKEMGSYLSDKIEKKNELAKHDKKIESFSKLLSARKPLFATSHIPELAKKISAIEKASDVLQKKDKDRFIGVVVFGGIHKGYAGPKSDIDFMLCGQEKRDRKLQKEFKNLTKKDIKLCSTFGEYLGTKKFQNGFKKLSKDLKLRPIFDEMGYLGGGRDIQSIENVKNLFHGIFFGNHQKLLELQKQTLKKINEDEWNIIRELIKDEETELGKAARYFDIKDKNLLKQIKTNVAIVRTPPPLEEAREIINRRYEQEMKKKE